jgi:hypothetical protein
MGIRAISRSSECSCANSSPDHTIRRSAILFVSEVGPFTIVFAKYDDAPNFEGRKILVYKAPYSEVKKQEYLDPHFCDDDSHLSPIARFRPDREGWELAQLVARQHG